MITTIRRACPHCTPASSFEFDIEHSDVRFDDAYVHDLRVECEHEGAAEALAADKGAIQDMLLDRYPEGHCYDGPMYSGEGGGDPRETAFANGRDHEGRRW